MAKSKTKIEKQLQGKSNPTLVSTVIAAKKHAAWNEVASVLTNNASKRNPVNLHDIEKVEGQTIAVAGKVLSDGTVTKKVKVAALSFSEKARQKLLSAGCEVVTLLDEIEKNKDAKGVVIIRR